MNCNSGFFGCGNIWWIIILLLIFCSCGNGTMLGSGCGCERSSCGCERNSCGCDSCC